MYRLSAHGKASETLDQQAESLPRRSSPATRRRRRLVLFAVSVVVVVLRPQPRLRHAARLEREHGARGRRVRLGARLEQPAVQVPRHVHRRAAVDEDGVAAPKIQPQAAELHHLASVDGDPALRVAVRKRDADLMLRVALREPRPRGPAPASDEPLPAPRHTRRGDRYPAVQPLDVPAAEVTQQEHELSVGDDGDVEPGGRLRTAGAAVPRGSEIPEHAHHAAARRECPVALLLVQVPRRGSGRRRSRVARGGGLVDGDGQRRPVGRPRPRDVDEQVLPGRREPGAVHGGHRADRCPPRASPGHRRRIGAAGAGDVGDPHRVLAEARDQVLHTLISSFSCWTDARTRSLGIHLGSPTTNHRGGRAGKTALRRATTPASCKYR
jgi:hypothetical protein